MRMTLIILIYRWENGHVLPVLPKGGSCTSYKMAKINTFFSINSISMRAPL